MLEWIKERLYYPTFRIDEKITFSLCIIVKSQTSNLNQTMGVKNQLLSITWPWFIVSEVRCIAIDGSDLLRLFVSMTSKQDLYKKTILGYLVQARRKCEGWCWRFGPANPLDQMRSSFHLFVQSLKPRIHLQTYFFWLELKGFAKLSSR